MPERFNLFDKPNADIALLIVVLLTPESVKFKLPSKAERLINTAFSPKILMFEFAPNGCRKTYIIKCLKHLISCEVQALFINRVSRIQGKIKKGIDFFINKVFS